MMWGYTEDMCCHLFSSGGRSRHRLAREGVLSELMYADDLVLMSERIEGLCDKFLGWILAVDSKGLKVGF